MADHDYKELRKVVDAWSTEHRVKIDELVSRSQLYGSAFMKVSANGDIAVVDDIRELPESPPPMPESAQRQIADTGTTFRLKENGHSHQANTATGIALDHTCDACGAHHSKWQDAKCSLDAIKAERKALVSDLADRVISLINSSPRSPTKAEIVAALVAGLDAERQRTYEVQRSYPTPDGIVRTCCEHDFAFNVNKDAYVCTGCGEEKANPPF